MSKREKLSIQLFKNSLVMYYENKNTAYAQRKEVFDKEDIEKIAITMLENINEKAGMKNPEKVHTYITLPNELVITSAMLEMPKIEKLQGNKLVKALELYAENALDLQIEKPLFHISQIDSEEEKNFMTVSVVNEDEISFLPELFFNRNFRLRSIEPEAESVRRFAVNKEVIDADKRNAIIHFFFDGREMNVGFYIFDGEFLCGHRYLPLDVYDHKDLKDELDVVLSDCEEKISDFRIDTYCVIAEREQDFNALKPYLTNANLSFLHTKYATNEGAILPHTNKKATSKRGEK